MKLVDVKIGWTCRQLWTQTEAQSVNIMLNTHKRVVYEYPLSATDFRIIVSEDHILAANPV